MKMLFLSSAELTSKLRDARGAKRRQILAELQRRYDETVPLEVCFEKEVRGYLTGHYIGTELVTSFIIPRYDFAVFHRE